MRDLSWDDGVQGPTPCTHETLKWLYGLSFNLKNEPNVPTREDSSGHASTIDLVFANETTTNTRILSRLHIDTKIGCLSDHHAITFTIGPPLDETLNLPDNGLNWKHADEEKFCKTLKDEIEQNQDAHTRVVRDLLNQNRKYASESKLDGAVKMIQGYLEQVATKTIPAR